MLNKVWNELLIYSQTSTVQDVICKMADILSWTQAIFICRHALDVNIHLAWICTNQTLLLSLPAREQSGANTLWGIVSAHTIWLADMSIGSGCVFRQKQTVSNQFNHMHYTKYANILINVHVHSIHWEALFQETMKMYVWCIWLEQTHLLQ